MPQDNIIWGDRDGRVTFGDTSSTLYTAINRIRSLPSAGGEEARRIQRLLDATFSDVLIQPTPRTPLPQKNPKAKTGKDFESVMLESYD